MYNTPYTHMHTFACALIDKSFLFLTPSVSLQY